MIYPLLNIGSLVKKSLKTLVKISNFPEKIEKRSRKDLEFYDLSKIPLESYQLVLANSSRGHIPCLILENYYKGFNRDQRFLLKKCLTRKVPILVVTLRPSLVKIDILIKHLSEDLDLNESYIRDHLSASTQNYYLITIKDYQSYLQVKFNPKIFKVKST